MNEQWTESLLKAGATFADGRVAHFANPAGELAAMRDGVVLCDLSHEGLILATGDDAAAFLHGQLSNDVLTLVGAEPGRADAKAQWNSWCSVKGRMLATFLMWQGKQGIYLQLPRAIQAAIQKRLQMFVLRSKVTLTDASDQWVKIGVASVNADALNTSIGAVFQGIAQEALTENMSTVHTDLGRVIRLSATRFEIIASAENAQKIAAALAKNTTWVGAAAWDYFAIRDGVIQVVPQTQDAYVPQMANFELIGGVSFKKGCYPGQEIVARTQYRGILKRRTVRVSGEGNVPNPGDSVYAAEFADQAAGSIALAAPSPNGGFEALVVAQVESIKANSLRLTSAEGVGEGSKLTVLPLPYELVMA
jgi:tRNA-modifying protein YgfZ